MNEYKCFITVRNSSCGKVMFSQACVKNSVRGEVYTPPDTDPPPGQTPHLPDTAWADTPLDTHPRHNPPRQTPPPTPTTTAADDTHPTGMHSCTSVYSWLESQPKLLLGSVMSACCRLQQAQKVQLFQLVTIFSI